jgi:hypothetical protein
MRFASLRTITLLLTALAVVMAFAWSCSTKTTGIEPPPEPPVVQIVNIPPNNSHFTTNPVIYWYGTDVDGYIVSYEYLVEREDTLAHHSVDVNDSSALVNYAASVQTGWTVVPVNQTEGNPTRQTVRLYAGQDPNDTVAQVFFVRAVDDDAMRSNIDFRVYSRNNHPPDTKVELAGSDDVFWDLPDTLGRYKGIEIRWEGSDKIDYPSEIDKPTFEYYFQLFGPYADIDTANLATTFDTTETSKLIFTAYDTTTKSVWLSDDHIKVFDLWRNQPASSVTRQGWFVAKATARDDAYASDPTPAYVAFKAIYPKFEKHLALGPLTTCANSPQHGNLVCEAIIKPYDPYPEINRIDTLRNFIYGVFSEAGYGDFEVLPLGDGGSTETQTTVVPDRATLGQYKTVVIFDDGERAKDISEAYLNRLAEYMDLGGNVWLWAPSPFHELISDISKAQLVRFTASDRIPIQYFDVQGQYNAAWRPSFIKYVTGGGGVPNDQFDRGLAIVGSGFNDFDVDLSKAWIYELAGFNIVWRGAQSTSYFERDVFSQPLYLIDSYYGDFVPDSLKDYIQTLQGKVLALRYDARVFKSAAFGFSIWMMHEQDAVDIVSKMMAWFDE